MKYTPRDYQKRAIDRARVVIRGGKNKPLIVAPTGSGKTVIACAIVEAAEKKGSRTLFIAHRRELIEQTSKKLDEIGIDHGVIKAGHPRVRPELPVQVGSVQTLARRLGKGGEGRTRCPFCGEEMRGWPKFCPVCEEELPRGGGKPPGRAVGQMVELRPLAERIRHYQDLARSARVFGRNPGWVAVEFKKRFGRYPRREEMGEEPALWTQLDEALGRRVWVRGRDQ